MTGRNHFLIAAASSGAFAAFYGLSWQTGAAPVVLAGIVGGLLPDIDHPQSIISGYIPGSSLILGLGGVRHRGITHSLLFVLAFALAWYAATTAGNMAIPAVIFGGFLAGLISHLVADMLTPAGIPLLYPARFKWRIMPKLLLWLSSWMIELLAGAAALVAIIGLAVYLWR